MKVNGEAKFLTSLFQGQGFLCSGHQLDLCSRREGHFQEIFLLSLENLNESQ